MPTVILPFSVGGLDSELLATDEDDLLLLERSGDFSDFAGLTCSLWTDVGLDVLDGDDDDVDDGTVAGDLEVSVDNAFNNSLPLLL